MSKLQYFVLHIILQTWIDSFSQYSFEGSIINPTLYMGKLMLRSDLLIFTNGINMRAKFRIKELLISNPLLR